MWWFLLLALAQAHVPIFDPADLVDIQEKSFGIYKEMKKGETLKVKLWGKAGEELVWSVHVLGSKWVEGEHPLEVSLYGHNTSDIKCLDHSPFRRLGADHGGVDQLRRWNTSWEVDYEAWGVGLYQTVASCKFKVPVDEDRFILQIKSSMALPLSVGVGEAERFDFLDYFEMSYRLMYIWTMDGYEAWMLFVSLLLSLFLVWVLKVSLRRTSVHPFLEETTFVECILVFSSFMFASRLIQVSAQCSECLEGVDLTIWLHIVGPLLFALLVEAFYPKAWKTGCGGGCEFLWVNLPRFLFLVYVFFFVWMTFRMEWVFYLLFDLAYLCTYSPPWSFFPLGIYDRVRS